MDQRTRCMQFLYNWVSKGHTSNLRKGMVEELQAFVNDEIAKDQANQTAARVQAQQEREAQADMDAVGAPEDKQ